MTQLDWKDILDIGLPELDKQHKALIGLSNSLIQAMVNGMGQDVLDEIFDELMDYTRTHFADEEAYMESIGYPDIANHKKVHAKMTEDVLSFRKQLSSDTPVSPNEALDFINDWIVKHIMHMDARIGVYAKNR